MLCLGLLVRAHIPHLVEVIKVTDDLLVEPRVVVASPIVHSFCILTQKQLRQIINHLQLFQILILLFFLFKFALFRINKLLVTICCGNTCCTAVQKIVDLNLCHVSLVGHPLLTFICLFKDNFLLHNLKLVLFIRFLGAKVKLLFFLFLLLYL